MKALVIIIYVTYGVTTAYVPADKCEAMADSISKSRGLLKAYCIYEEPQK